MEMYEFGYKTVTALYYPACYNIYSRYILYKMIPKLEHFITIDVARWAFCA